MLDIPLWLLFYAPLVLLFAIATERWCLLRWSYNPAPTRVRAVVGLFWPVALVLVVIALAVGKIEDIE